MIVSHSFQPKSNQKDPLLPQNILDKPKYTGFGAGNPDLPINWSLKKIQTLKAKARPASPAYSSISLSPTDYNRIIQPQKDVCCES